MITLDSIKSVSKRPAPIFFFREGCRILFVRLLPKLQQVLEARVPKGPLQKHQRNAFEERGRRKTVRRKTARRKQVRIEDKGARRSQPIAGPWDLVFEMRTSQGNAAVKELAPDKSNNTFTKSELVRVEALVQQHAFER